MSHGFARNGLVSTTVAPIRQEWQRPSDWLSLPTVSGGDEKLVGLYKIINGDNWFAVSVTGAYTIDWGDGTTTDTASGTTTYKNLSWSSYSGTTATTDGFRQAIITITPQSGSTLTSVNLNVKHNQSGLPAYATGWLDVKMAGASLTTLTVGGGAVYNSALKRFEFVGGSALTSGSVMFSSCYQLATIVGTSWTSGISDFNSMFWGCSSLSAIPLINTAAGTFFNSMFNGCSSLSTIPLINTAAGTSFANMFQNCVSLSAIPLINTAAGTSFASMFLGCVSLSTIPLINTAAGTSFASMFQNCVSLSAIPLINTAAGTSFASMFIGCSSLSTIPLINTAAGTSFTNMFNACTSLRTVPALNTAAGTSFTNMFNGCSSLESAPLAGTRYAISYASCALSSAELDAIYTGLGTAAGSQTITVTSNYGTTGDTPSIATGKGWTVTGS